MIDYKTATDILFGKVKPPELAEQLGTRAFVVNRARVDVGLPTYRGPPPGWAQAIVEVAKRRVEELNSLIRLCEVEIAGEAHEELVTTLLKTRPALTLEDAQNLAREIETRQTEPAA